jgi:hypothetical protein
VAVILFYRKNLSTPTFFCEFCLETHFVENKKIGEGDIWKCEAFEALECRCWYFASTSALSSLGERGQKSPRSAASTLIATSRRIH